MCNCTKEVLVPLCNCGNRPFPQLHYRTVPQSRWTIYAFEQVIPLFNCKEPTFFYKFKVCGTVEGSVSPASNRSSNIPSCHRKVPRHTRAPYVVDTGSGASLTFKVFAFPPRYTWGFVLFLCFPGARGTEGIPAGDVGVAVHH